MKLKAFILGVLVALPIAFPATSHASDAAEWNILFFLNGKNNLQGEMQDFLLKRLYAMSDGKSGVRLPDNVNILAEYGTIGAKCDSGNPADRDLDLCKVGVKRFRMIKGVNQVTEHDSYFQDLGRVDMGDASSLVDFAVWSRKFPARHTMLYIFDHGAGYESSAKGLFSFDEESGHAMNSSQVSGAFRKMASALGRPIDIFVTDMCQVGSTEALGQMEGALRYYVASRESVSGYAVSVIDILRVLEKAPDISAKKYAYQIVLQSNHYEAAGYFSAFDLGGLGDFKRSLSDVVAMILRMPTDQREATKRYFLGQCTFPRIESPNSFEFRDVLNCFRTAPGVAGTAEYQNLARDFFGVMYTNNSNMKESGLSIWGGQGRRASASAEALADYRTLQFDQGAHWSDFIAFLSEGRN